MGDGAQPDASEAGVGYSALPLMQSGYHDVMMNQWAMTSLGDSIAIRKIILKNAKETQ